jgi:hypothetical protein
LSWARRIAAGRVEHGDAGVLEPLQRPETLLDPVELPADVEPCESDVAVAECQQRIARREQLSRNLVPAQRGERQVRQARPVADDRETHPPSL